MVKHQTFLTGIDHFSIVKGFKFLCQLSLLGQLFKNLQHCVVHLFGGVIVYHALCHGNTVLFHTLCAALPIHHLNQIYLLGIQKFLIRSKRVHIVPVDHNMSSLDINIFRRLINAQIHRS